MTPGTTIGRYVVKRKLAEGGMAEILLCAVRGPEGFEKEVVLKRIRSHFAGDPGFVRMFVDEARVVSRLHHPNIVQVFDFDQHEDSYYLAMEYVRGKSLWDLRKRCREQLVPLPPVLVAFMAAEVARALDHAHGLTEHGKRLGLVHRDVTPHNVLLSFDGAVKLADFGIVKSNQGLTAPGTLKGKLAYMSPEQARGEQVDARTDVFALGIVLWELLTGGRLFEGGNEMAILRAVQESAIAAPVRLNPDVPAALSAVVERALQRGREARYQSAAELERALREVLLAHARAVEDTDVGGFLRRMFPEEGLLVPAAPPGREAVTALGRGPLLPAPSRGEPGLLPPFAAEAPTLVVGPGQQSQQEPSQGAAGQVLGMRQALAVGGAAVLAGALLTATVGLWQGRRIPPTPGGRYGAPAAVPGPEARGATGAKPDDGAAGPGVDPRDSGMEAAAGEGHSPASPAAVLPEPLREVTEETARERIPNAPRGPATPRSATPSREGKAPGVVLEAREGRAPTAPAVALPAEGRAVAAAADSAPANPDAPAGTLQLRVIPWAQAWVDGKPLGEVGPQRDFPLPPGVHQLRLEHPRGSRQISVQVKPGEVTALALDMLAP